MNHVHNKSEVEKKRQSHGQTGMEANIQIFMPANKQRDTSNRKMNRQKDRQKLAERRAE